MVKSVARVVIGTWALVVAGAAIAPLLWPALAEARSQLPRLITATTASTAPAVTFGPATTVTTLPTTTTKPPVTRPRATTSTTAEPTTTTEPPTTVAPLPAAAPPPVTLPLATGAQSGHVSAVFPILGGVGLVTLIGLLVAQWFLTKPGRRGPTL